MDHIAVMVLQSKGGGWVGDAASGIGLLPLHIDSFSKLGITEVLSAYRKK